MWFCELWCGVVANYVSCCVGVVEVEVCLGASHAYVVAEAAIKRELPQLLKVSTTTRELSTIAGHLHKKSFTRKSFTWQVKSSHSIIIVCKCCLFIMFASAPQGTSVNILGTVNTVSSCTDPNIHPLSAPCK